MTDDSSTQPNTPTIPGPTEISPAEAWDAVKKQLRLEMDRAAYAAFVADTWLLDYHAGTFLIAAKDDHARDWASSRLTDTAARVLLGLIGHAVSVRFVTAAHTANPNEPLAETLEEAGPDEHMLLSVERGLFEAFTRPDTALYFPGYWLRWVPYIGPKPFATILAFRQALYIAEAEKNGRGDFKENSFFAVSAEKVGRIIGLTSKTIRRQRDGYKTSGGKFVPPQLGWFLTVRKTNKVNFSSGTNQFAREAHQYAFRQSPVTPGDVEAIIEWLLDHDLEHDPVKALEAAVAAQPKELIPFPMPRPSKVQLKAQPGSARGDLSASILAYCREQLSPEERRQVLDLAEKLRARILASDGQVKVPLYFLRHILPVIGAPAAILITYLRKRAYRNTATGEIREEVVLDGGIAELANLLGVRTSAVYYHLPIKSDPTSDSPASDRDSLIGRLIYAIDNHNDRLRLSVSTADVLIPAHQQEYERALSLAEALLCHAPAEEIEAAFELIARHEQSERASGSETDSKNVHIQDSNFVHIDVSKNVHIQDSNFVPLHDSENVHIGLSENVHMALSDCVKNCPDSKYFNFLSLEILKDIILDLKTNINTLTTTAPADSGQREEAVAWKDPVGEEWDLESLSRYCRIDRETRKALLENQASASAFVSHLIYAFSPEGASLNQPVRFALSQVLRPGDGDLGHGPRHDRLAGLGPVGLQQLIRSTEIVDGYGFRVSGDLLGAKDWAQIMDKHTAAAPLHELGELLGLLTISY